MGRTVLEVWPDWCVTVREMGRFEVDRLIVTVWGMRRLKVGPIDCDGTENGTFRGAWPRL